MPKNAIEVASMMIDKIGEEERGVFKPVYDALKKLDESYPKVTANHHRIDLGPDSMEFAYANLLFSSHAAYCYPDPPTHTRKDALHALKLMNSIPRGRITVMTFLCELFPQAVICVEQLYFLQRQVRRIFTLPDAERPELLRNAKLEDWVYPEAEIDKLRIEAIDLWKGLEDQKHADETQ